VRPAAKAALAKLAQILNDAQIVNNEIQVVGHTDDIPIRAGGPMATRNPDNWTLSTNRAWSVLDVLHTNGLKDNRGMAAGWGEQRPIADNAPGKRGNEKNRRVDIYIRPTTVPEGLVVSTPGAAVTPRPTTPRTTATRPAATPTVSPSGVPLPR
jgi:chemotaxis protein MotB